ncbi:MAG TPA: efflux RND transporter periplasmic adaptor subunit, partial [Fimbriimonadaceae bacterium]|nr:efflux RND transporter periplasmic adaptor subunit [Fimbriimonadaceae bacterium]
MKRWIVTAVVLIGIVALVGWRMMQKTAQNASLQATAKERTSGAVSVSAAVAGPRDIEQTLEAVGTIQSPNSAKLSPKIAGLIDYLEVREGDLVRAGQVLVKLDPDTTTATVLQNAANVAQARERYTQARLTQDPTNVGVSTAIGQQKAAVDSANANLNQVTQNLSARIAAAQAAVDDGDAKIAQARAGMASAEASLGSAKATLKNAETKLQRDLDLYKQNYIAAQDVDDQKTTVEVARANVNVAQKGVDAAEQGVQSAISLRGAAKNQLEITKKQGDADVAVARASLKSATEALKLAVSNRAQSGAYQANLDALKASIRAAEGTLQVSKVLAADTNLMSPIDGSVTARLLDPGSIAQPGSPILTIQFLKWVYFNASVPIEEGSKVAAGQKATVMLDALPGQTFIGKVAQVNASADPTSHQFLVLVKLDNPNMALRPGMYGHIHIVVSKSHASVTVPREAVNKSPDGTTTVFRIDSDSTVHSVPVKLGAEDSNGFQILDGLREGDRVVSLSYNAVKDGKKVNVTATSTTEAGGFGVDK